MSSESQVDVKFGRQGSENTKLVEWRKRGFGSFKPEAGLISTKYSEIVRTKSEYSESVRTILELFRKRTYDFGMHSQIVRTLSKPSKTIRTILEYKAFDASDICQDSKIVRTF